MEEKINKLKERLDEAKINYEVIIPENPEFSSRIKFEVPAAREKHECLLVFREERLDEALNSNFDKFRFIKGYEAIWSKDLNTIESEVSHSDSPSRLFFSRLQRLIDKPEESEEEENDEEVKEISLPTIEGINVSIGYCSKDFSFLTGSRERGPRNRNLRRITIKLNDCKVLTHDSAREKLEKISNSIFFQIDLAFEIPINLQSQRESYLERRSKRMRKQLFVDESASISEPKYEYDSEPISLYWYAKESNNMPLFQFLAFYQTIEFYFPIYSSFQAKQKIQSLIKDPRFNPNRDTDISKIISIIKVSGSGNTFGSEREQLKATISGCTDNQELRDFFEADESRLNFYLEKKGKDLSKQNISLKNPTADLVHEVMERIYEIRCRIVHSKASEGDFAVLLPYSNEIKRLNFDIELVEFISRKVLITSSRPLKL